MKQYWRTHQFKKIHFSQVKWQLWVIRLSMLCVLQFCVDFEDWFRWVIFYFSEIMFSEKTSSVISNSLHNVSWFKWIILPESHFELKNSSGNLGNQWLSTKINLPSQRKTVKPILFYGRYWETFGSIPSVSKMTETFFFWEIPLWKNYSSKSMFHVNSNYQTHVLSEAQRWGFWLKTTGFQHYQDVFIWKCDFGKITYQR